MRLVATVQGVARGGYLLIRRALRAAVWRVRARWRGSLQLRVVTSTLVVSALVTGVLGFLLMQQIASGLLRAKENASLAEHAVGYTYAENEVRNRPEGEQDRRLDQIVTDLARRSGSSGVYEVAILPVNSGIPGRISNDISEQSVPDRLRAAVRRSSPGASPNFTYTRIYHLRGGHSEPGLVVGAPLGKYELYYIFPLTHEADTLELVRRTLIAVGAALVLLLAAIASMVTRQVVLPVRLAAQSAERLAAGELSERMHAKGEDDLAKLAMSFNDMARNLQEKIRELEELSQVQRQFVSDVSHELRTPLTTVRIAADLLYESREDFDTAVARSAELLQSQLERFEGMLTDLLEISRHDAGAATLLTESVDVRDVVLRAVGDSEQIAEHRGIKVILRLPAEPCMAEVDSRRVERVLRNLVVNAIEHGEGKDVIVTAGFDRFTVAIAVRDFGVGLKPGEETLVFDRFWRADPARARTTGGTGLGLAIAREDALLHGGWLQAWGEPGKGSQFRLSLPRVAGTELRGSPLPLVPPEIELARGRPVFGDADAPSRDAHTSAPAPAPPAPAPARDQAGPDGPAHDAHGAVLRDG
ncbi:MAG: HAMP domain-containing protein [Streptosporangiales bacterium]|nr:HAMP domain-containing protein [Streptosporangiales bacterium]